MSKVVGVSRTPIFPFGFSYSPNCACPAADTHSSKLSASISILSSWPHIFWFDLQSFHILLLLNQNEESRSTYNYQCIRKTNPNSSRHLPHRYAFCYHVLFPRNLLVQKADFILIYLPCNSCMYGTQ